MQRRVVEGFPAVSRRWPEAVKSLDPQWQKLQPNKTSRALCGLATTMMQEQ